MERPHRHHLHHPLHLLSLSLKLQIEHLRYFATNIVIKSQSFHKFGERCLEIDTYLEEACSMVKAHLQEAVKSFYVF